MNWCRISSINSISKDLLLILLQNCKTCKTAYLAESFEVPAYGQCVVYFEKRR